MAQDRRIARHRNDREPPAAPGNYRLNTIFRGQAWIADGENVHVVGAGDTLGNMTIVSIDPAAPGADRPRRDPLRGDHGHFRNADPLRKGISCRDVATAVGPGRCGRNPVHGLGAAENVACVPPARPEPGHLPHEVIPVIVVGALLLNLRLIINKSWNSMAAGTIDYGPVAYAQAADFGKLSDAINAVLTIVSVAGGCYFFKGLLLLKRAAVEGQSSQGSEDFQWRALTHMIGGCLLIQIADTIERFRQTAHIYW
ncbi:conjugal transfer protein TraQ [Massilia sp. H-1]|nr:conjugal transfer protein TraQ [Massilia sp. H-1]